MRIKLRTILIVSALGLIVLGGVVRTAAQNSLGASPTLRWYRGNTHTHTINSDGDSSPDVVAKWYRENGYQFVVITDHEFLTDVAPLNGVLGANNKFMIMRGQELTQHITISDSNRPGAHVNAINPKQVVLPLGGREGTIFGYAPAGVSIGDTLVRNVAQIRKAGGIAQINHPNWQWSVKASDMTAIPDGVLLEIWNAQPGGNNLGGTDDQGDSMPSVEDLWDGLLSRNQVIWGVASDDSHTFRNFERPNIARPGLGWICVRAASLTLESITDAIAKGQFYSSTGPTLEDYIVSSTEIRITIKPAGRTRYMTKFIGRNGRILGEVPALSPSYKVRGDEGYVRAKVFDSNGKSAWTQPVFIGRK